MACTLRTCMPPARAARGGWAPEAGDGGVLRGSWLLWCCA